VARLGFVAREDVDQEIHRRRTLKVAENTGDACETQRALRIVLQDERAVGFLAEGAQHGRSRGSAASRGPDDLGVKLARRALGVEERGQLRRGCVRHVSKMMYRNLVNSASLARSVRRARKEYTLPGARLG
jgi:hypothetical protein